MEYGAELHTENGSRTQRNKLPVVVVHRGKKVQIWLKAHRNLYVNMDPGERQFMADLVGVINEHMDLRKYE